MYIRPVHTNVLTAPTYMLRMYVFPHSIKLFYSDQTCSFFFLIRFTYDYCFPSLTLFSLIFLLFSSVRCGGLLLPSRPSCSYRLGHRSWYCGRGTYVTCQSILLWLSTMKHISFQYFDPLAHLNLKDASVLIMCSFSSLFLSFFLLFLSLSLSLFLFSSLSLSQSLSLFLSLILHLLHYFYKSFWVIL